MSGSGCFLTADPCYWKWKKLKEGLEKNPSVHDLNLVLDYQGQGEESPKWPDSHKPFTDSSVDNSDNSGIRILQL